MAVVAINTMEHSENKTYFLLFIFYSFIDFISHHLMYLIGCK
ncbi:hypothetical protein L282_4077 [Escherichia coli APEC IMT5155]|nr:hypothetical protein L282_4077 [Escherichia coli APEC IMT5155]